MLYSTSSRQPALGGPRGTKSEPFVVYARIVPEKGDGRRFVYVRDMEREADRVERLLTDMPVSAGDVFDIALPIAFTPQVGQQPARLTITGFRQSTVANQPPVEPEAQVIHSGTVDGEKTAVMDPVQGNQNHGDTPTAANMSAALALKDDLESAVTGLVVMGMVYQGVRYGTMPNKKGFFSWS